MAKSDYPPLFVALEFGNGLQYRTYDFERSVYDDLATSCKDLVNFGPVTPEFKRVNGVHPCSISSSATFALLLDFVRISTEFSGRSLLNFVSPIRWRASLLCRAGYKLGSATHL